MRQAAVEAEGHDSATEMRSSTSAKVGERLRGKRGTAKVPSYSQRVAWCIAQFKRLVRGLIEDRLKSSDEALTSLIFDGQRTMPPIGP